MEDESRDYVRPPYRHSVLNVERQLTNKIAGIIFVISVLLWLVIVTYSVIVPIESSSELPFDDFDTARIFISIGFILLSGVFTLIVFIALRWIPHITSLILWTFWLPVPIFVAASIYQPSFWSIYSSIGSIFSCLLMLILLKSEWFHLSEAVLKEACKMIISVPSTFVFALFSCLLSAFVFGITAAAIIKLYLSGSFFTTLLIVINCAFGVWTLFTIMAICWMTLSGTFAEYYYAEDKGSVSLGTVLDFFRIICRYHVGTAALCNPLLGGITALGYVVLLAIYILFADDDANETLICLTFLYNVFDPVILRVLLMGSAVNCSIRGEKLYSSLGSAAELLSEDFITVVKVLELLMGLSSTLVLAITSISTFGYLSGSSNQLTLMLFIYVVLLGGMVFIGTLLTCLTSACYSVMLCLSLETSLRGTAASCDSYTSSNLHSAVNHHGAPNWFRNYCSCCIPDFEFNYTE